MAFIFSLFPCEILFPTVDDSNCNNGDKRISDKGLDAVGAHVENTKGRCWSQRWWPGERSIIWCRGLKTITHAWGYLLCVLVKYNISQLQLRWWRSRSRRQPGSPSYLWSLVLKDLQLVMCHHQHHIHSYIVIGGKINCTPSFEFIHPEDPYYFFLSF